MYFFDELTGLVGIGIAGPSLTPAIYKTTDGGTTWKSCSVPATSGGVLDIKMKDGFNGLAAVWGSYSLWRTSDGGNSWMGVGSCPGTYGTSVYQTGTTIIKTDLFGAPQISIDNGVTFSTSGSQNRTLGLDFVDDLHGVMTTYRTGTRWQTTSDGGKTWVATSEAVEAWSVYGVKGTTVFYTAEEGNSSPQFLDKETNVKRSVDYGRTWTICSTLPFQTTGHITGIGENILFVQTARQNNAQAGIYYSKDKGSQWLYMGGPGANTDCRFSAVLDACGFLTVYAADNAGRLYRWYERDTVTNNFTSALNWRGIAFPPIFSCSTSIRSLPLTYTDCGKLLITDILIEDSGSDVFTSSALSMPLTLGFNDTLLVPVTFSPQGQTGMLTGYIRIKAKKIRANDTLLVDTLLPIRGISNATIPSVLYPESISLGRVSLCGLKRDTVIELRNTGCDTITIDQTSLPDMAFQFPQASFPIVLAPDSSITVTISFMPAANGIVQTSAGFEASSDGLTKAIQLFLTGEGYSEIPSVLYPDSISFGGVSLCGLKRDTVIELRNTGCDTITIDQTSLPDVTFQFPQSSFPIVLAPDSFITVTISFMPAANGFVQTSAGFEASSDGLTEAIQINLTGEGYSEIGQLNFMPHEVNFNRTTICLPDSASFVLTNTGCDTLKIDSVEYSGPEDFLCDLFNSGQILLAAKDTISTGLFLDPHHRGAVNAYFIIHSNSQRDTVYLSAFVADGSRILSSSHEAIEFVKTSLCEELDSNISLTNNGCDTLVITAPLFLGNGFDLRNVNFPVIIPPHESRSIDIQTQADTIGGKTSNTATLTFTSNADNQITPLTLSRGFVFAPSYDLGGLAIADSAGTSGDLVRMQVLAGNWWQTDDVMHGVQRLDFDLAMNTDLLHFVSASTGVQVNGSHVTITGNPDITAPNGVVAEFTYQVHLTKDTATDILLSNLSLNNGDLTPCKPTIQGSGNAAFNYRYVCGDRAVQTFLRTGKAINITSIRPNPALDEVIVEIVAEGQVTIEVYDAVGKLVQTSRAESGVVVLPVHELSSGSYVMRVASGGGVVSRSFVVKR